MKFPSFISLGVALLIGLLFNTLPVSATAAIGPVAVVAPLIPQPAVLAADHASAMAFVISAHPETYPEAAGLLALPSPDCDGQPTAPPAKQGKGCGNALTARFADPTDPPDPAEA